MGERQTIWTPDDTRKLIHELELSPCLWNMHDKTYKNKQLKSKKLNELSAMFDTSVYEIQRKLHNLRCQFTGQLRKSKANEDYTPPWPYYEALSFLEKTVSLRYSNNIEMVSVDHNDEETFRPITEDPTISDDDSNETKYVIQKPSVKRKLEEDPMRKTYLVESTSTTADDLATFGSFVTIELRNLEHSSVMKKAKRDIMRILMDASYEDENLSKECGSQYATKNRHS